MLTKFENNAVRLSKHNQILYYFFFEKFFKLRENEIHNFEKYFYRFSSREDITTLEDTFNVNDSDAKELLNTSLTYLESKVCKTQWVNLKQFLSWNWFIFNSLIFQFLGHWASQVLVPKMHHRLNYAKNVPFEDYLVEEVENPKKNHLRKVQLWFANFFEFL